MNVELLNISDLIAGYGDHNVLDRISLLIKERSFTGIIGPNGSGKSTFMQVLARSIGPLSGSVLVRGESLESIPFREFGKTMGFVPQESEIPFAYTVNDIVMMGRNPHIPRFRQPSGKDREMVYQALKLTGTEDLAERVITSLSGGERQRVLIARIIAQDTDLLLLDEPFAHMDLHHQHELFKLMRNAARGKKTVIGVFHDINLAASYCDHLVVFNEGKVHTVGTPDEILNEELLREIFKIEPVIADNPVTGTPYIYVCDNSRMSLSVTSRVHIISGGGSGSTLASMLNSAGFIVSCGVLSENDSDCQFARNHGLFVISEPPFSGISQDSMDLLYKHLRTMDRVVVTELPVGWGNFANIQILKKIPPEKIILMLTGTKPIIPDFTGGEATKIFSELIECGSFITRSPNEIVEYLKTK